MNNFYKKNYCKKISNILKLSLFHAVIANSLLLWKLLTLGSDLHVSAFFSVYMGAINSRMLLLKNIFNCSRLLDQFYSNPLIPPWYINVLLMLYIYTYICTHIHTLLMFIMCASMCVYIQRVPKKSICTTIHYHLHFGTICIYTCILIL